MSKSSDLLNKTWTLEPGENLDEEQFMDSNDRRSIMPTKSNPINTTIDIRKSGEFRIDLSFRSSIFETPTFMQNNELSMCDTISPKQNSNNNSFSKIIYDIENVFNKISNMEFVSLFDETTNGIEFENGEPISLPIDFKIEKLKKTNKRNNLNNLTVNMEEEEELLTVEQVITNTPQVNETPITGSNASSADNLNIEVDAGGVDKLNAASSDPNLFNAASIPNTFDRFVNDLKMSAASVLTSSNGSIANERLKDPTNKLLFFNSKILTSSVDKDLNKETISSSVPKSVDIIRSQENINAVADLKKLISFKETKTSSPYRPTKTINRSYTIETDEPSQQTKQTSVAKQICSKFNSNESLSDNVTSSKSYSSSSQENFAADDDVYMEEDDEQDASMMPRTVFNTTYTSWSTNEEQLRMDALIQHHRQNRIATTNEDEKKELNKTQDLNNNNTLEAQDDLRPTASNANLNKTIDIINEDDLVEETVEKKDILNRTHEIIVDESKTIKSTIVKPEIILDNNQEVVKTKLPSPSKIGKIGITSRISTIQPSTNTSKSLGMQRPSLSYNTKPTSTLVKSEIASRISPPKVTSNGFEFKKPEVPPFSKAMPVVSTTNSTNSISPNSLLKAKTLTSIPRMKFGSQSTNIAPTSSVPVSSSTVGNPAKSTTMLTNGLNRLNNPPINSSSFKENKKSPVTVNNISSKLITPLSFNKPNGLSNIPNGIMPRLQKQTSIGVTTSLQSTTSINHSPTSISSTKNLPFSSTSNVTASAEQQKLISSKIPMQCTEQKTTARTQIPTFRSQLPTLRNSTNSATIRK